MDALMRLMFQLTFFIAARLGAAIGTLIGLTYRFIAGEIEMYFYRRKLEKAKVQGAAQPTNAAAAPLSADEKAYDPMADARQARLRYSTTVRNGF